MKRLRSEKVELKSKVSTSQFEPKDDYAQLSAQLEQENLINRGVSEEPEIIQERENNSSEIKQFVVRS